MPSWSLLKPSRARVARTRKWVTVLFTDIIGSTQHWHELGDIDARIQLDKHDQLLKSVVAEFDGLLIKTIGDSLMVTFEDPDNAIRAAIAMQHLLEEHREKDPEFELKIRIGLHRGRALVEENDVYGNTVNVASRVESQAGSGEILVSDWVTMAIDTEKYCLTRIGSFVPKGKTNSVLLFRVNWWREESRLSAVKSKPTVEELEDDPEASEPEVETTRPKRKKPLQALALLSASIIGTVAVAAKFLPSLLGDYPGWASLLLNPMEAAIRFPQESLAAVGVAVCATWISLSLRWTQGAMRSALRGGAAFSTIGIGLFIAIDSLPREIHLFDQRTVTIHPNPEPRWVEIRGQAGTLTAIHDRASDSGKLVATASVGERFVLSGIPTDNASGWLRIHLAPGNLAWISKKSSADGPAHAIDPATDIQLGEAEALAFGFGLIVATAAILLGWWRDWLERQTYDDLERAQSPSS